jgi:hypothetical protein
LAKCLQFRNGSDIRRFRALVSEANDNWPKPKILERPKEGRENEGSCKDEDRSAILCERKWKEGEGGIGKPKQLEMMGLKGKG